MDKLTK